MSNTDKESPRKSKYKNFGVFFANRKLVNTITAVGFAIAGAYHVSLWHSGASGFHLALGSGFVSISIIYAYHVYSEIKTPPTED